MNELRMKNRNGTPSFSVLAVHSAAECADAAKRLSALTEEKRPDLLVFCGDTVKAPQSEKEMRTALEKLTASARDMGIPFLGCFGDRDRTHAAVSEEKQRSLWQTLPGFAAEPLAGTPFGDCVYPVYGEDGNIPALLLWCMDSHGEVNGYEKEFRSPYKARLSRPLYTKYYMDGIRFGQTMWYWRLSREFEERFGRKIPGMMFFHTPLTEFGDAVLNASVTGMRGTVVDTVSCQTVNGGLFSAAAERHDIRAIVCGHDGRSAYAARYCGMMLAMTPGLGTRNGDGLLLRFSDGVCSADAVSADREDQPLTPIV